MCIAHAQKLLRRDHHTEAVAPRAHFVGGAALVRHAHGRRRHRAFIEGVDGAEAVALAARGALFADHREELAAIGIDVPRPAVARRPGAPATLATVRARHPCGARLPRYWRCGGTLRRWWRWWRARTVARVPVTVHALRANLPAGSCVTAREGSHALRARSWHRGGANTRIGSPVSVLVLVSAAPDDERGEKHEPAHASA